ncbi:hypothetical protein YC2023_095813 [Brassica napus]
MTCMPSRNEVTQLTLTGEWDNLSIGKTDHRLNRCGVDETCVFFDVTAMILEERYTEKVEFASFFLKVFMFTPRVCAEERERGVFKVLQLTSELELVVYNAKNLIRMTCE